MECLQNRAILHCIIVYNRPVQNKAIEAYGKIESRLFKTLDRT